MKYLLEDIIGMQDLERTFVEFNLGYLITPGSYRLHVFVPKAIHRKRNIRNAFHSLLFVKLLNSGSILRYHIF